MLSTVLFPLLIAGNNLQAPVMPVALVSGEARVFIAGRHHSGGRQGDGPDHGDDPNDEQHDDDLPANKEKNKVKGPGDPYSGTTPNDKNHPFTPY